MAYDPDTDEGYVRLLISDTADPYVFSDTEITAFLQRNPNPKRAAAAALLIIAANEALVAKKITTQDLATDGPALAEALRKLAADLRKQADDDDAGSDAAWGFEITPAIPQQCGRPPELTDWPVW